MRVSRDCQIFLDIPIIPAGKGEATDFQFGR